MAAAGIRHSVCALDCPDACSILVHLDESGRATRLQGNPEHPITRGFLCAKVTKYLDREYHADRLLYPQKRVGPRGAGRFVRITWDEALDEIASRFERIADEFGSEAILPYSYAGTMGYLNGSGMDRRFFHRLGASRLDRTICASAGGEALMQSQGIRLGIEPEQFANAKLILAWGANILGTSVHLWPWIVEARRRGAKFYVIDPVRNRTGRVADRHFAIRPGSDLALALGLAHVILRDGLEDREYIAQYTNGFDTLDNLVRDYTPARVADWTGIPPEDIESLAREYATMRPSAIRVNYGVQRSERGGSAVRAIAMLPVLTGAWRYAGGGLQLTTSGAFQVDRQVLERPDLQQKSKLGREARLVNMSQLGSALTELDHPPVKALLVYNSNPAAVAPDQNKVLAGLLREDLFTVVLEHLPTETAQYADILLPATTFLEHADLYFAYGHYYLQWARPTLPAPGEAKSNVEIFRGLAKRMGFDEPCFHETEEQMVREMLQTGSPYLKNISFERLDRERFVRLNISAEGQPFLPFARGEFATPSRRFEFGAESLAYTPPTESRWGEQSLRNRYPLELVSSKNDNSLNSTFGYRAELQAQTAILYIHPRDAEQRDIRNGDLVRIFNARGECRLVACPSDDIQPGVLWTRSIGWWQGINRLTSERLTDIGGGPTFYSCLVDLERVLVLPDPEDAIQETAAEVPGTLVPCTE